MTTKDQLRKHTIEFNKWLEANTTRDDNRITTYRYDGAEGMGNYILEDIYDMWADMDDDSNEPPMCHFCSGTGMGAVNEISCSWCKGTGIEPHEKEYDI